jgi:NADH:ubiquinone oxidoreductase subunit 6 (subunit J)
LARGHIAGEGHVETKDYFMRFAVISAIVLVGMLGLIVHLST